MELNSTNNTLDQDREQIENPDSALADVDSQQPVSDFDDLMVGFSQAKVGVSTTLPLIPELPAADDPWSRYSRADLIAMFETANSTALAREEEVQRLNCALEGQRLADVKELKKQRDEFTDKLAQQKKQLDNHYAAEWDKMQKQHAQQQQQAVTEAVKFAKDKATMDLDNAEKYRKQALEDAKTALGKMELAQELRADAERLTNRLIAAIAIAAVLYCVGYFFL